MSQSMRRNKFEQILQNLYLADSTKTNADRYHKIRPLYLELSKSFKLLPPTPNLSIDESNDQVLRQAAALPEKKVGRGAK